MSSWIIALTVHRVIYENVANYIGVLKLCQISGLCGLPCSSKHRPVVSALILCICNGSLFSEVVLYLFNIGVKILSQIPGVEKAKNNNLLLCNVFDNRTFRFYDVQDSEH